MLSDSFSQVEAAILDNKIAEDQYGAALSRLENARLQAASKLMDVEVFLHPELPQQTKYPHRKLYGAIFSILALAALLGAFAVIWRPRRA